MELKSYPFCGKSVTDITSCVEVEGCEHFETCDYDGYFCIVCDVNKGGCGASGGYAKNKEKSIEKWNNRLDNWISVEERLPEVDPRYGEIEVLVHMDDGFIATTTYAESSTSIGFELWAESGEVTHWQPLPEPPKGSE